jgi:hypothetical protein
MRDFLSLLWDDGHMAAVPTRPSFTGARVQMISEHWFLVTSATFGLGGRMSLTAADCLRNIFGDACWLGLAKTFSPEGPRSGLGLSFSVHEFVPPGHLAHFIRDTTREAEYL